MEKTPHIDPELLGDEIQTFYGAYPYVDTLGAILASFQKALDWLDELAENDFKEPTGAFDAFWSRAQAFADRLDGYIDLLPGADAPNEIEELILPPLFEGEYGDEVEDPPSHPDVQTLWRLANEYFSLKNSEHEHLGYELETVQEFVEGFWEEVRRGLIGELSGEDVDVEIEAAIDRAAELGEESTEAVTMGDPSQGPERASIAPLLLGIGAILWMSKRK
jgi:hypothetical protein